MLVAIEGYDGSGKGVVASALSKILDCESIHFPNDEGYTGVMIRDYLSGRWEIASEDSNAKDLHRGALAFQSLQVANRMEVMPKIRSAKNLVLDRYWQSGVVYGKLDGLDPEWLHAVHEDMVKADVNILLDLDASAALERQSSRGQDPERYEAKLEVGERVVALYRDLWDDYVNCYCYPAPRSGAIASDAKEVPSAQTWVVIDASQDVGSVIADAIIAVRNVQMVRGA